MTYLFCLPFPNRASDSGDLYIDFNRNHLIFPVALLDFQVEARFIRSLANNAYASHTASRISYRVHVLVVYYVVCFLFWCLLLRVGSGNVAFVRTRLTMFVCLLHGLVLLPCGISGKMTIPSKSLLSLLARCSLFCYAYAMIPTTCLSCLPNCHVKPLTHHVLANRCLAMLPLCSARLIALLVAGEDWRPFLVGTLFTCLGYHYIAMLS